MIPEAWVISLDDRPDRLAVFRKRAMAAHLNVQELVVPRCTTKRDGWGGSAGACGNAISHHQLLTQGTGPLLVFEDDAMLPPDLTEWIELALWWMPPKWDLCLLGAGAIIADHDGVITAGLMPIRRFALTHAYLVSERGRVHLAEVAARASWHWDHAASHRMCGRGKVYGFVPTLVQQDQALGSDIP